MVKSLLKFALVPEAAQANALIVILSWFPSESFTLLSDSVMHYIDPCFTAGIVSGGSLKAFRLFQ